MTPQQFIAKWQAAQLSERSACQQHFLDLCDLLGQPKPADVDRDGSWYTFERGVTKSEEGKGWADVWMKDHFGWEYKGKRKDLKAAYNQLLQYHESLDSPPLLVVCDLDRFEIHTKFTGAAKKVYAFDLAGLADAANLDILRKVFTDPSALRPGQTSKSVTEQAAEHFGQLADALRLRGVDAHDAAHFLMKLMFCMFAEDIDLLPSKIFSKAIAQAKREPAKLTKHFEELFAAMATGGTFALEEILYFNGGLFAEATVIPLRAEEIPTLAAAADFDWSVVEPHIFGTLFERMLDPAKRSQIGAHYTSREDIETLLEPVVMQPLRREWAAVQEQCAKLLPKLAAEAKKKQTTRTTKDSKPRRDFNQLIRDFIARLDSVTVLDPACGSGNFLYVALRLLLDLEKEVITFAANHGLGLLPQVRPTQLHGIEINPLAQQLAQVVIWIGYLQWMRDNGFNPPRNPVLEPIESIEHRDAILDLSDPEHPKEPAWPAAEFIVGNPPFLGNKQMRSQLGSGYVDPLWKLYGEKIPATSDLCCYWFERAKEQVASSQSSRVGLLATTGIKQVGSRRVLERIGDTCRIYWAASDREWILDGAAVRIAMVGFGNGSATTECILDDKIVGNINPNLTSEGNLADANRLDSRLNLCFMGTTKVGDFDIDSSLAAEFLQSPNASGLPNSDVIRPWRNGSDLVRVCSNKWIIDFGSSMEMERACHYELPFEFLAKNVKPFRMGNNRPAYRERWWIHAEARPGFRRAIESQQRYIATARVAKHRIFQWLGTEVIPDSKVIAIALDDSFSIGVLHSRIHELWTLATCAWHGKGNDATYNPTTCFETFPFPEPTDAQRAEIAEAAKELDDLRSAWLNPPEWTRTEILEFPGSVDGPWARYIGGTGGLPTCAAPRDDLAGGEDETAKPGTSRLGTGGRATSATKVERATSATIGVVRYPRVVAKDEECAALLKKRTLTNLYNQRPAWLDLAHRKLDAAVFAAYGWPTSLSDDELLAKLLALNVAAANQ